MKRLTLIICCVAITGSAFSQGSPKTTSADAQRAFETIKTLAGSWQGRLSTTPKTPGIEGSAAQVSIRVTSRGNAVMHDLTVNGIPDNPITMFYLDADRLLLTHYCDAGNRPRMEAKFSADGRAVEFNFLDITGPAGKGHMHHALFTIIDADHHTEDWTLMMAGNQSVQAHFDFHRAK